MPNKPISMVKIRQVLRCHATGLGSKTIAAHLEISRTTVKKYIHIYQTCGKSFAEIMSMDDMELYVLFQEQPRTEKKPVDITPRQAELDSLLPSYSKRLKRRGWTKERLYPGSRMSLMDIIEDRYGKKTTILTSQVPVKNWYDSIGDKTVADTVLDWLVHNALRIELHGE